jgi:Flp pilus assembly protein CpaB
MRRGRIFFYLAFILILGLVAVVVVWQKFLQPKTSTGTTTGSPQQTAPVSTVNVVVVTQRVPRGSLLDENVLKVITVQQDLYIQGMFNNTEDVIGKQAKFDLDAGIPLTKAMLASPGEQLSSVGSNAALNIPHGMVAVSLPISRLSAVSYAPQAGDHINLIVTMMMVDLDSDFQSLLPNRTIGVVAPGKATGTATSNQTSSQSQGVGQQQAKNEGQGQANVQVDTSSLVAISGGGGAPQGRAEADPTLGQTFYLTPSEPQRPRLVSQTLLQDITVLRMGNFPLSDGQTSQNAQAPSPVAADQPTSQQPTSGGNNNQEVSLPDVVTLIVSPQDANTLNYLMYAGAEMTLALRSAGDDGRIQTEAVTLQFLLDQYRIPLPVKLPYGLEPRMEHLAQPVLKNDAIPTKTP